MRRLPFLAAAFALAAALVACSNDIAAQVVPKVDPKNPNAKVDPKNPNAKVDPKNPNAKVDPKADPKGKVPDNKAKTEPPKKVEPKKTAPPPPKKDDDVPVMPPADDLPLDAPNPLDLVRGLREKGLPDLAIQFLDEIAAKKLPLPPLDQAAVPLERAKCLLELADDEADDAKKSAHLAEAKEGFERFLKTNATHPRAPEAQVSLARQISREARFQLAVALRADGDAAKAAEAAKAQPQFKLAASRFSAASKALQSQIDSGKLDPRTKRRLEGERIQAVLDSGINQYEMRRSFIGGTKADVSRSDALKDAQETFESIGNVPKYNPLYWVSRAWVAECLFEAGSPGEAKEEFAYILRAVANPAAAAGIKLVKLFELRREYDGVENTDAKLAAVEKSLRDWLRQYDPGARAGSEVHEVRFLLGLTLHRRAILLIGNVPKGKPVVISAATRKLLEEAERAFRALAAADNDFTDKAAKRRTQVVRVLIGDADKPAADYPTFELCQMAALVQMAKVAEPPAEGQSEEDAKKSAARHRAAAIELLERARDVATEKDPPADVLQSQLQLVYMYQTAGQPDRAAVLGEHLARTGRGNASKNALAGAMAVVNYSSAAGGLGQGAAEDARRADRARAISLATHLDTAYPADPLTDTARHRMAELLIEEKRLAEAYDVLLKVRPGYPRLAPVRSTEGVVAYQLLVQKDSPIATDGKRAEVYDRALADLSRVPNPGPDAKPDDARTYLFVRSRVAQFHMIRKFAKPATTIPGYADAEKVAAEILAEAPKFTALDDKAKLEFALLAEELRVRAVVLQARGLDADKKYPEMFEKIGPTLGGMAESGPAKKDGMEGRAADYATALDKNRQDLIVLALRGRIREGKVEEGGQLLDLLKKFGGTVEAMASTLQQLAVEIRGTIATLRKSPKPEDKADAEKLTAGFGALLGKLAAEPGLKPDMQIFIGYSLQVVGEYDQSAGTLKKVFDLLPEADTTLLTKPFAELPAEQQAAVSVHRRAALYLAQSLRQGKKYDDAQKLVAAVVGTKEKSGWGANSIDFRREAALLAEARAALATEPKAANELWKEALAGWAGLANQQRAGIIKPPMRAKQDKGQPLLGKDGKLVMEVDDEKLAKNKAAYYDFYFENQRCLIEANMHLLKDPPKVQEKLEAEARKMVDLETKNPDLDPKVRARYNAFLDNFTLDDAKQLTEAFKAAGRKLEDARPLKEAYHKAGGKLFLNPPADAPGGM